MHRRFLGLALAALVVVLPACGGGDDNGDSSGAACPAQVETKAVENGTISICASDIKYDVKTITTAPGPLTVTLTNNGSLNHTFKVDGVDPGFELKTPSKGDTQTGTVTLEAGEYEFVCTVSGHEQQGMKGKILVS
jgi:plastocyanin